MLICPDTNSPPHLLKRRVSIPFNSFWIYQSGQGFTPFFPDVNLMPQTKRLGLIFTLLTSQQFLLAQNHNAQ